MSYLEELLPEFRNGAKIRRREWPENLCISLRNSCGLNIPYQDVEANDWEFVKDQAHEPDWDYIIKNRCLCWFWDANYCKMCNILQKIDTSTAGTKIYIDENNLRWNNCRPVRRDEVTFYEEKKDE